MRFWFSSITDARRELRRLDEFITLAGSPAHQAKLVGPDGSEVALPDQVYDVLRDVVKAMSRASPSTSRP